ncbi:MAG: leucine-rich repeat domain-containing protein [Clostridia bacterium]|nr:leucine-rich repeat domain-containing protein [Clostridia bacterium]
MFFEDEEFSDKNYETEQVDDLNVDNEDWTINNGKLEEYKKLDEEEVRVPEGVTEISPYAISFNGSVRSIFIPKSVQRLESDAIVECDKLTRISIENENIELIESAISDNISLEEVYIGGKKIDCLIAKIEHKDELCFEKYLGDDSELDILDGIKRISAKAFADCKSLERVYIPESVTDISFMAFANCVNIRELKVPQYIEFMGGNIFSGWTENQTIYVPKTFKGLKFLQPWRRGCKAKIIYY